MVDGLTIDEESRKLIAKYAYKQNKQSNHLMGLWIKIKTQRTLDDPYWDKDDLFMEKDQESYEMFTSDPKAK